MTSPTVLIVDDDRVNRKVLGAMLGQAGFLVRDAATAEDALSETCERVPDVVLLDVEMPGHDGYWLCEQLRESPATSDVPVIFISAREDVADKLRGFQSGAADFITKPFRQEEVLARVKAHVRIRQLGAGLARANRELSERQREIDDDLRASAEIQKRLVPRDDTSFPGLDLSFFFAPSALVGGDVFNAIALPDGRIALYILDVSGHGAASALMTFAVSQALLGPSALLRTRGVSPAAVVADLDDQFPLELFGKYFTLAIVLLDPRSGELEYTTAGHPPPRLVRASGEIESLDTGGPAPGLGFAPLFESGRVTLGKGDRLFLFTDGVCDQPHHGTRYGSSRLWQTIRHTSGAALSVVVSAIREDLIRFADGGELSDDAALCAIEFQGSGPPHDAERDQILDTLRFTDAIRMNESHVTI